MIHVDLHRVSLTEVSDTDGAKVTSSDGIRALQRIHLSSFYYL